GLVDFRVRADGAHDGCAKANSSRPHSQPIFRSARDPEKWMPVFRQDHASQRLCRGADLGSWRVVSPSFVGEPRLLARTVFAVFLSAAFYSVPSTARAQAAEPPPAQAEPQPEMRENCPGLVARGRPPGLPAALRLAALDADQVRLTFIGHST